MTILNYNNTKYWSSHESISLRPFHWTEISRKETKPFQGLEISKIYSTENNISIGLVVSRELHYVYENKIVSDFLVNVNDLHTMLPVGNTAWCWIPLVVTEPKPTLPKGINKTVLPTTLSHGSINLNNPCDIFHSSIKWGRFQRKIAFINHLRLLKNI